MRLHDTQENRITALVGFLIVGLIHLDYSIDSCITLACIRSIRSDRIFAFYAGSRFFLRGREREVEGR